jgi:hypothetical protein
MSATTTTTAAAASTLPASTALSTTTSSSQLGLCFTNPTAATYATTYGTGIKAAALVAAPFIFSGAAILGVALLSYAVTKAAIDPS